jgi:hypothetical protein
MSEMGRDSSKVPEWNIDTPSLRHASIEQRQFYKFWRNNLEHGAAIDIKGNLSYLLSTLIRPYFVSLQKKRLRALQIRYFGYQKNMVRQSRYYDS